EADLGQAEGVVEEGEREERGEPRQQDDLEAAGGHGLVEGAEPGVAGQPLLDKAAGQGAPQPEGERGARDAGQGDDGRADDNPEEGAGSEGDDRAREDQAGKGVDGGEDDRAPGPAAKPAKRLAEGLSEWRMDGKDDQAGHGGGDQAQQRQG